MKLKDTLSNVERGQGLIEYLIGFLIALGLGWLAELLLALLGL